MSIASRLKQARKSRGYTQEKLANELNVSRGVISNIEYEKAEPQKLVINAICEVLKINKNWLITGQGNMENNPNPEMNNTLLSEIYNSAKNLSKEEQDYILDMIKTFQKHRTTIIDEKEN